MCHNDKISTVVISMICIKHGLIFGYLGNLNMIWKQKNRYFLVNAMKVLKLAAHTPTTQQTMTTNFCDPKELTQTCNPLLILKFLHEMSVQPNFPKILTKTFQIKKIEEIWSLSSVDSYMTSS